MITAWQCHTRGTEHSRPTELTGTLPGQFTVPVIRVTAFQADGRRTVCSLVTLGTAFPGLIERLLAVLILVDGVLEGRVRLTTGR